MQIDISLRTFVCRIEVLNCKGAARIALPAWDLQAVVITEKARFADDVRALGGPVAQASA